MYVYKPDNMFLGYYAALVIMTVGDGCNLIIIITCDLHCRYFFTEITDF